VTQLDSWLAITRDGGVAIFTSKVDLGTGVLTALSQVVAEELDVPVDQIHMQTGDTANSIDQSQTSGSRTLHKAGPQLRQAAAAGRRALLDLASTRLGAPVEKLVVSDGIVSVTDSPARKVSYGDLIGGRRFDVRITASGTGADLKVALEATAKDPKSYKIVGTSVPRVDLPAKFTGEFKYSIDVSVPGMLHGRVVRPPVADSRPLKVDEESIADIPGIVRVVREGNFIGVVAATEWSAIQAAAVLKVTWSGPEATLPVNRDELFAYLKNKESYEDQVVVDKGNLEAAFAEASKTFEAEYRWPFQMHGMLGPSCAVADVREDQVTVWTGTQGPFRTRKEVARLLRRPEKSVRIVYVEGAGCYGRLCADDVAEDAAIMSRAVGKPVRVQWSRADEHGWEPKGPPTLVELHGGLDASGNIVAWRSEFWIPKLTLITDGVPLVAASLAGLPRKDAQNPGNIFQNSAPGYAFPNVHAVCHRVETTPFRPSWIRTPGRMQNTYANEAFMDELAAAAGADPVEFRLRHLNDPRGAETLKAAARRAGWTPRPSPRKGAKAAVATGRGVTYVKYENVRTYVACVAEVEVERATGAVRVTRVVVAHDCGQIINPDGVRAQVEGNVIQTVSRTLKEELKWDRSMVTSLDWKSYPILTFPEAPRVDVELLSRPAEPPWGAGEPSAAVVPSAISNAIFDAVGARVRTVPFTPARVQAAIRATT